MIPFYVYYSMFGFQRTGDLAWAAGDMRARGFLVGGTSGRTTLNGEGLQHEDGHSHILSATIPNCVSYDPTFSYEVAVIVRDGLRRMIDEQEDVFYYLTLLNENYPHPAMPAGAEEGIVKGMYLFKAATPEPRAIACSSSAAARSCARSSRARSCLRRISASSRHLERDELHRARPRGAGVRALELAPPARATARALSHAQLAQPRRGPGHRLHRLHEAVCRADPRPLSAATPTASSAPTASAAPTIAANCAATSRSTATSSPRPPSKH